MIALQIPDDAHRSEVILAPQKQNLLRDVVGGLVRVVVRDRSPADETSFTPAPVGVTLPVEAGPA